MQHLFFIALYKALALFKQEILKAAAMLFTAQYNRCTFSHEILVTNSGILQAPSIGAPTAIADHAMQGPVGLPEHLF